MFRDPFRCLIDELLEDILNLHTYCLIFDEIRRQKEASEGTKWKRRVAKVTGKDATLEPLSVIVYQDNAFEIRKKVERLDFYFNDLKSRYLWAQNHIAEQNILKARSRRISKAKYLKLSEDLHENQKPYENFKDLPKLSSIVLSSISSQKATEGSGDTTEAFEKEAVAIDNRMHIITLLEEIRERDEYIGILTAQLKIKNQEVTQLMEIIRRERLGLT